MRCVASRLLLSLVVLLVLVGSALAQHQASPNRAVPWHRPDVEIAGALGTINDNVLVSVPLNGNRQARSVDDQLIPVDVRVSPDNQLWAVSGYERDEWSGGSGIWVKSLAETNWRQLTYLCSDQLIGWFSDTEIGNFACWYQEVLKISIFGGESEVLYALTAEEFELAEEELGCAIEGMEIAGAAANPVTQELAVRLVAYTYDVEKDVWTVWSNILVVDTIGGGTSRMGWLADVWQFSFDWSPSGEQLLYIDQRWDALLYQYRSQLMVCDGTSYGSAIEEDVYIDLAAWMPGGGYLFGSILYPPDWTLGPKTSLTIVAPNGATKTKEIEGALYSLDPYVARRNIHAAGR